jgi:F-type H+-transporting ATPase subunit b
MGTLLSFTVRAGEILQPLLLQEHGAEGHGFGLNFDILETNLINLSIVIGVLIYFGRGFLGNALTERRSQIESAIQEAEQRKKEAAAALADQQQKLAQAQAEASRIRAAAEESAKAAKQEILDQATQEIERMRASAAQDLESQQERIVRELRQQVAAMAMEQVEARLKSGLNDHAQQQLIDRSIAMLGGR